MNWLLPSVLAVAGVAAVATLALHFIARGRPLAEPLPTARFIPQQPVHARARSIAWSDGLLLALRIAAIVAVGAGVAGPVVASHGVVTRIVVADRSRDVANVADVRDSARAYLRAGDQLIEFDSAVVRTGLGADSMTRSGARGSLSAALATALHVSVRGAPGADSIEMVLVSPLSREEIDDATFKIRNAWPGRIRVVPVRAAVPTATAVRVETSGAASDAVVAGLALLGKTTAAGTVRLVRTRPTVADSAWARLDSHVLLVWPASAESSSWPRRTAIDTIGGVANADGDRALIATFPRLWSLAGAAVARWADGEPAVVEHATGGGCVRDVGILIDDASDITLRPSFRELANALRAPCGGARDASPIGASFVASIAGPPGLASAAALRDRSSEVSRATPWLLALGALLLMMELAFRRTVRRLA